jgi:hypothetical protein
MTSPHLFTTFSTSTQYTMPKKAPMSIAESDSVDTGAVVRKRSATTEKRRVMTATRKKKERFLNRLPLELKMMIYEEYLPFHGIDEVPNLVLAYRGNSQLHHEAASLYFGNENRYIYVSWTHPGLFATASEAELGCIKSLALDFKYLIPLCCPIMQSINMPGLSGYRGKSRRSKTTTEYSAGWFRDLIRFSPDRRSDQLTHTSNVTELDMRIKVGEVLDETHFIKDAIRYFKHLKYISILCDKHVPQFRDLFQRLIDKNKGWSKLILRWLKIMR